MHPTELPPEEIARLHFEDAKRYELPFGKYKGYKLDDIAKLDSGLLYLDWLRGQNWINRYIKKPLERYLDNATIAKELSDLLEKRKGN